MIKHSITKVYPKNASDEIACTIRKSGCKSYHKLDFVAGPSFTDMKYSLNTNK
jgi:hypothetical protein